ncbi:MAG TPA: hypothetical protein VGD40_23945, partial [Chryseosolibacter sp.]
MLQPSLSDDRNVKIIIALFILVNAVFLFSMPLLPFIDLPNHLAEATIYRFYGEEGNVLSNYYKPTPWYFPNTFHTVFCSLFPDVELGNKIFHILCIALMQVSVFIVIRQLKGNVWYGLLGTLFTYNYNFTYGFVGFAISTPTLILLFYLILRDFEKDTIGLKISIALLLILLFLMHAQNALFGLVLFAFMTLYKFRNSIKQIVLRGIFIPLPLIILIFTWWFTRGGDKEESTSGYLLEYYLNHYFQNFLIRFRILVFDNFQLREGVPGLVIAAIIFALIIIPIVWFKPWKEKSALSLLLPSYVYPIIFFLTGFLCYMLLPDQLPGQSPLFQRFCTIVILSFIIVTSVWLNHVTTKALKVFVITSIVLYTTLWFEYIYSFNRINAPFNATLFEGVEKTSRMAGLIYDHKYRGRKVYIHFPNYFIVWNQGIAASKIIDYRFGVVRRVAAESEVPFYTEYIGDGYKKIREYHDLDFLLVKGEPPVKRDENVS